MLEFKEITLKAMAEIRPLLEFQPFRSCDFSIGGIFMWREYFNLKYCIVDGMLIWTSDHLDNGLCYSFPVGSGDLKAAVDAIRKDAAERNIPLRFCSVPKEFIAQLSEAVGRPCEAAEHRQWADYLYPYENFLGYHGKKLVTQRNHCNRFKRDYPQYEYRRITPELLPEAKRFLTDNYERFLKDEPLAREDLIRSIESVDLFCELGYTGGLLSVDGRTVGLTVGDTAADTLYIQIEKALTEYAGVYPMLASLYAAQEAREELHYINREDDSGSEGLRHSKMEYRPIKLVTKYLLDFGAEK